MPNMIVFIERKGPEDILTFNIDNIDYEVPIPTDIKIHIPQKLDERWRATVMFDRYNNKPTITAIERIGWVTAWSKVATRRSQDLDTQVVW